MLILLPPSETKRDGGEPGTALSLAGLSYPSLGAARRAALDALVALSSDPAEAMAALKLGPKLAFEISRNRAAGISPVMPAMDRYTGVLYDGLDTASLSAEARGFLARHVVIASALFGLVGAGDAIPAYRLSHDSRLPALHLKNLWRDPVSAVLGEHAGLILDLRSESYTSMGPVPTSASSAYLRVVSSGPDGVRRALNHFNKKGKGEFVRALAQSATVLERVEDLIEWASARDIHLEAGAPGELELRV